MKNHLSTYKVWMLMGFSLLTLSLMAQEIEVNAPSEVLESETFQIHYHIYSAEAVRKMPNLLDAKDYELLQEPQVQRSSPSYFFGKDYYTFVIVYTLKAKKTGNLKLPRIEAVLGNRKILSDEGVIKVLKTPKMDDVACFVKVNTTKQSVTRGDTLTLEYKLYSTKEISRVLNVNIERSKSFYYQSITPRWLEYTEERIDGVVYKVYTIGKYILQAKSWGVANIPEGEVHIEYTYPTGRKKKDAWGRIYDEELREVKTCLVDPFVLRVHNMTVI